MSRYRVGIFIEAEIEAEDDISAIHEFMGDVSYKDCCVELIDEEDDEEGEE